MKRKQSTKKALGIALILFVVFVFLFSGLKLLESTVWQSDAPQDNSFFSTALVRDGVKYYPRTDLTVIAFMGIDEMSPVAPSNSYRNAGEADALVLLVLDKTNESYSILAINRDSMVTMPSLGVGGQEAGTFYGQIALSHTYGSGMEDSARNTVKTISDLLYGLHIDYYVAMNMGGIPALNDALGGVTVEVTEDFSAVDPTIGLGTVTLRGEQALHFVRTRKEVGDQLNLSRMQRHESYMKGLMQALESKLAESESFVMDTWQAVSSYMVTDCSVSTISTLLSDCSSYTLGEILSLEGNNVRGQEHYEFYLDEAALDAVILRLFYSKK